MFLQFLIASQRLLDGVGPTLYSSLVGWACVWDFYECLLLPTVMLEKTWQTKICQVFVFSKCFTLTLDKFACLSIARLHALGKRIDTLQLG
jgi:hypothetical protein